MHPVTLPNLTAPFTVTATAGERHRSCQCQWVGEQ